MKQINCFEPTITKECYELVDSCLKSGALGFGPQVLEFESSFKNISNKKFNIGLSSASAAAYVIFAYLYEKYGSCDVYTPSMGFVSPAWAAKKNGHRVIFVDVNESLLFDWYSYLDLKQRYGNPNSRSILMPVLYGGVGDIPGFSPVDNEIVVVDSAHCVSPKIHSDYIFFSFHPTKPICMSSGGMLSCNSLDASVYFSNYRNFGRQNTSKLSYDIIQNGFKFYMDNLNASLGLSQLDIYKDNISKRKANYEYLDENLAIDVGRALGGILGHNGNSSYYLATIILNKGYDINSAFAKLSSKNIFVTSCYPPLHQSTLFRTNFCLPNTEFFNNRILNVPIHQNLTNENMQTIVEELNKL